MTCDCHASKVDLPARYPYVPGASRPGSEVTAHPLSPPTHRLLKHPLLGPGTVLRASGLEW